MADPKNLPDIQAFLSDPKHANDKAFMFGVLDAWAEKRAAEAKERAKTKAATEGNIFDKLFGGASDE